MSKKFNRNSMPDFTHWTEDQQMRYNQARTELDREKIMEEVQKKLEDEEFNNAIIQKVKNVTHINDLKNYFKT